MQIIAHRGNSSEFPENTLSAFQSAFEMENVFGCELDVHLSKDKQLIVFHDNTLDRSTGVSGWIREFSYNQLKDLDAGNGEKIPRLLDVLQLAHNYDKKLFIEIKGESEGIAGEVTTELIDFVDENGILSGIEVVSFWHAPLRLFKKIYPTIPTALLSASGMDPERIIGFAQDLSANGISSEHSYVSKELVEIAHAKEMSVNAWTVNDRLTFDRMAEFGVDYITTNSPKLYIGSLESKPEAGGGEIFHE